MTKWIFALAIVGSLLTACQKDPAPASNTDQIVLLKVDYLTTTFEGAHEWTFPTHSTLNFDVTYRPPGDFGNLTIHYREENAKVFDGDIIWMGTGTLNYPTTFNAPSTYPTTPSNAAAPLFDFIEASSSVVPDASVQQALWNAIKDLDLVQDYLTSNPNGKAHFFLYTPSVGVGDPAEWDWMIFLKD